MLIMYNWRINFT